MNIFRALLLGASVCTAVGPALAADSPRPNILWLTSEDHGPHMGCYGDRYATTPHMDALAAKGLLYTRCWSNAPVCAPARTTLISGIYPPSLGAEHMRSLVPCPEGKRLYPQFLREAGYYCTNNAKEDYNISQPGRVWDDSSRTAHWTKRAAGQPFFAVFNSEKSHESKLRIRPHQQIHDPARVRVPAYHPDTPEVRLDWAQYHDTVTEADTEAGLRLQALADAGLAEDTIVFYFADHGSGMPRNKRWPRNSGLHVPLLVYIPEKFQHLRPADYRPGGQTDRLVSFVDFAPTVLSLAGVQPPEWMQGHAFLGKYATDPQPYIYGFRGRMDERQDLVRCVTDGRYVYIRNFRPDKIYGQHLNHMWQTPTTRVWERLFQEGRLNAAQSAFWKTKPAEELYDLTADPDEIDNLAAAPQHAPALAKLRQALREQMSSIRDVGLLTEGEMHRRSAGSSPYDMGHDPARYPFTRVYETADAASSGKPGDLPRLQAALKDPDSAVRYWAALGLLMRGEGGVKQNHGELTAALDDATPDVRVVAAEALGRYGVEADVERSLQVLREHADWGKQDVFTVMAALNAVTALGQKAGPSLAEIVALPAQGPVPDPRYREYVPRLLESLRAASEPK